MVLIFFFVEGGGAFCQSYLFIVCSRSRKLNRIKGALDFLITARFGVEYNSIHRALQLDSFGVPHRLEVNRNQACGTDHIESHHNFCPIRSLFSFARVLHKEISIYKKASTNTFRMISFRGLILIFPTSILVPIISRADLPPLPLADITSNNLLLLFLF